MPFSIHVIIDYTVSKLGIFKSMPRQVFPQNVKSRKCVSIVMMV